MAEDRTADQIADFFRRFDPDRLRTVVVTAPPGTLPGSRSIDAGNLVPGDLGGLQNLVPTKRGGVRGFERPPSTYGVPPAPDEPLPELPEIVAEQIRPSLWQRFNTWLRQPSTKKKGDVLQFTLDYYVNNYMPSPTGFRSRLPRLSRSGPKSFQRQRGFVAPVPTELPPLALPELPPIRVTPRQTPPIRRPENLPTLLPLPVLRPAPPPGYEDDPDFHPDLIAPALPVPLPSQTPSRERAPRPLEVPTPAPAGMPLPFVQPSPWTSPPPMRQPTPQRSPSPSPIPSRIPVPVTRVTPRPVMSPARTPNPFATPVPLLSLVPTPGRSRKPTPNVGRTPKPVPAPTATPAPQPFTQPAFERAPPPRDRTDECTCEKEEKKPKKPRKPRKRCFAGTYRERSMSLSKSPRREVPCL